MMKDLSIGVIFLLLLVSCFRDRRDTTPWGTAVDAGEETVSRDGMFSLSDIQNGGEMIMLTLSGPETYYDYHGRGMGQEYLLCEKFAQLIGVSLRVELCKDTAEMLRRLDDGEGDVIAFPMPKSAGDDVIYCGSRSDSLGTQWAVRKDNQELADTLDGWFRPELIAQVRQEEDFLLSARSIQRRVFSPMLDRKGGVISHYDHLFRRYASSARMDWRLMAAQCYQESCFDPNARSWAGARGLMQIMPQTAAHLGLPLSRINDPEANIAASAKYMAELSGHFRDVPDATQRVCFVLAAYNGGFFHIRDAMALARKYGRNPNNWAEVEPFVLKLRDAAYYRDPVVKYGYMRGNETVDYVARIRSRWAQYRGMAAPSGTSSGSIPARAKKKHRFKL